MNYLEFRNALLSFHVFSIRDAQKHLPEFDTRRLVEWKKKGYITKVINRQYLFNEIEKNELLLYRISNCLYTPSYISMESALSYYNLIPEAVYTIQAVTTKKTQLYETPVGAFNYRSIKPVVFFGYTALRKNELPLLMAEKEKAILDYFYLNNQLTEMEDIAALRLNISETGNIDWAKFGHYQAVYNSKALNRGVLKFLNHFCRMPILKEIEKNLS